MMALLSTGTVAGGKSATVAKPTIASGQSASIVTIAVAPTTGAARGGIVDNGRSILFTISGMSQRTSFCNLALTLRIMFTIIGGKPILASRPVPLQ
jgi:hypothetical protein